MASFHLGPQQVIRVRSLEELSWLQHGFGTARSENWPPGPVATVKQIHSDRVLLADGQHGSLGEADALIASLPGTVVAIRTADCLPILIADPVQRVVAAIHAGWRGTVAQISTRTVETLASRYGSKSGDMTAAIGPGIGECCFEVGAEVASRFGTLFPERNDLGGRTRISLTEANRRQLLAAGVQADRITAMEACTCCGGPQFHSFRRNGELAGRMVSAIGILA